MQGNLEERIQSEKEKNNIQNIKMRDSVNYISVEECAKMLNLSKATIYQMLKDGRIYGAFRINRSWRIPVVLPSRKQAH